MPPLCYPTHVVYVSLSSFSFGMYAIAAQNAVFFFLLKAIKGRSKLEQGTPFSDLLSAWKAAVVCTILTNVSGRGVGWGVGEVGASWSEERKGSAGLEKQGRKRAQDWMDTQSFTCLPHSTPSTPSHLISSHLTSPHLASPRLISTPPSAVLGSQLSSSMSWWGGKEEGGGRKGGGRERKGRTTLPQLV